MVRCARPAQGGASRVRRRASVSPVSCSARPCRLAANESSVRSIALIAAFRSVSATRYVEGEAMTDRGAQRKLHLLAMLARMVCIGCSSAALRLQFEGNTQGVRVWAAWVGVQ